MKSIVIRLPAISALVVILSGCDLMVSALRPCFASHGKRIWQETAEGKRGHFSGTPELNAIAPHVFLFTQAPSSEQKFSFYSEKYGMAITPESMVTNGASVPRAFWGVKGLGPLDFSRAAIIHDWIFEAHHRYRIAELTNDKVGMKRYEQWGKDDMFEKAANIMAECIHEEMAFYSQAGKLMDKRITEVAASKVDSNYGDVRVALAEMKKNFSVGAENPSTLGMYHWAIASKFAKKIWNPQGHSSSVTMVRALKDDIDTAVTKGFLGASVRSNLLDLIEVEEKREEEVGTQNLVVELSNDTKVVGSNRKEEFIRKIRQDKLINVGAVYLSVAEDRATPLMAKIEDDFGAYQRAPRNVGTVPQTTTEVRYYYTEDKNEAMKLVSALSRQGVRARASYVVDPQIQARRSYQIAFAKDAFATFSPSKSIEAVDRGSR